MSDVSRYLNLNKLLNTFRFIFIAFIFYHLKLRQQLFSEDSKIRAHTMQYLTLIYFSFN